MALSPRECQVIVQAPDPKSQAPRARRLLHVTIDRMRREFSAGGVLVRRLRGRWFCAAIRPAGKKEGVWALPKGLVGPGEKPNATALREVEEETGARGRLV